MRLFSNRHHAYGARQNGKKILLILGITLLSALILTVVVGNLLKIWLDEETYKNLTDGEETTSFEEPLYRSPAPNVHAYAFVFGDDFNGLSGASAVSLSLNTPAGEVNYTSDVTSYFDLPLYRDAPLETGMGDLKENVSYISGVFYPQALKEENEHLQYAKQMEECALLREFLESGGDEILLCDLPFEERDNNAIFSYIRAVKRAAENDSVGIAIPWELTQKEGAWSFLGSLLKVCDFLALDMRNTSDVALSDCAYYIEQYDMRLLFCATQAEYIDTASPIYTDLQTVTKPPQPAPEPDPDTDAEEAPDAETGE